jgi:NAD(P)-dependent dehydrogenase (short-subunit alcohol dehydrogenase family)
MSDTRIALVTGANKGIGFEIARSLGQDHGMTVLVGARDEVRGKEAPERLGGYAVPVRLDVTSPASVTALAEHVAAAYGRLHVLVNNAGILLERGERPSMMSVRLFEQTFATNVFGVVALTNALLPLLRVAPDARIVNLGSGLGSLAFCSDPTHVYGQNPLLAYNASKSALNAVTVAYAAELRSTGIKVNAADPGYCATDLNGHSGPRTPAQGAIAAVRLATLPADGPTGGFFDEDGPVPW